RRASAAPAARLRASAPGRAAAARPTAAGAGAGQARRRGRRWRLRGRRARFAFEASLQESSVGGAGLAKSAFTPAEIAYLGSQRLGRIATVGLSGEPHAVPVGFRYNAAEDAIDIGGHGFAKTKKFRDAQHNPRVAFVVDDLASVSPWR